MYATGWCAYITRGDTKADAFATCLYEAASHHLPGKHLRTDYTDGNPDIESAFYILRHAACSAVLTENFFMDALPDNHFLLSEEGQQSIVETHLCGIRAYLSDEI